MTMKIRRPNEALPERAILAVIYGLPGVGKTSISFTAGKTLHLDFDRSVSRAVQSVRPISIDPGTYGEFREWFFSGQCDAFVKEEGIETMSLDTVGTLLDDYIALHLIKANVKNSNGAGGLSLQGWGAVSSEFNLIKSRLIELNVDLIAVAHAKEVEEDGHAKMRLAVRGGSADILYRSADLIGYVFMNQTERQISFLPTEISIGKDTGRIGRVTIPDAKDPAYPSFFSGIIRQTKDAMSEVSAAQIQLQETLNAWAEDINGAEDAERLTIITKMAFEIDDPVEKDYVREMVKSRMAALELIWDRDQQKYVSQTKTPAANGKPAEAETPANDPPAKREPKARTTKKTA